MNFYANMKKNLKVTFGINKALHRPINERLRALEPHAKFLLSLFLLMLFNISVVVSRSLTHGFFCNVVVPGGI